MQLEIRFSSWIWEKIESNNQSNCFNFLLQNKDIFVFLKILELKVANYI